jgi:hypothetical protein
MPFLLWPRSMQLYPIEKLHPLGRCILRPVIEATIKGTSCTRSWKSACAFWGECLNKYLYRRIPSWVPTFVRDKCICLSSTKEYYLFCFLSASVLYVLRSKYFSSFYDVGLFKLCSDDGRWLNILLDLKCL